MVTENDVWKKRIADLEKRVAYLEEICNNCKKEETDDVVLPKAIKLVQQYDMVSTSLLQRSFSIGYARAARLLDQLEKKGIVGAGEGAKLRIVIKK